LKNKLNKKEKYQKHKKYRSRKGGWWKSHDSAYPSGNPSSIGWSCWSSDLQ